MQINSLTYLLSCFFVVGATVFKKPINFVVSSRIWMKLSFVLQVKTHRLTESGFDVTSYVQDGGHDVISRPSVIST